MVQIFVGAILLVIAAICSFGFGISEEQRNPWDKDVKEHGKMFFALSILLGFAGALMIGYH